MARCSATNTGNGKRCKNTRINGFTKCSLHISNDNYKRIFGVRKKPIKRSHGYTISYRTYGRDLERVPEVFKTKAEAQKFHQVYSFQNPRTKFSVVKATEKHKKRWSHFEQLKSKVGFYDWR